MRCSIILDAPEYLLDRRGDPDDFRFSDPILRLSPPGDSKVEVARWFSRAGLQFREYCRCEIRSGRGPNHYESERTSSVAAGLLSAETASALSPDEPEAAMEGGWAADEPDPAAALQVALR